jgi:hypothetical protein
MQSRKALLLLISIALAGCGTIQVYEEASGIKRIEQHTVGVAYPSRASLYTSQDVQADMSIQASKECPNGFEKLKEQYIADDGAGKDKLVWYVKCL